MLFQGPQACACVRFILQQKKKTTRGKKEKTKTKQMQKKKDQEKEKENQKEALVTPPGRYVASH